MTQSWEGSLERIRAVLNAEVNEALDEIYDADDREAGMLEGLGRGGSTPGMAAGMEDWLEENRAASRSFYHEQIRKTTLFVDGHEFPMSGWIDGAALREKVEAEKKKIEAEEPDGMADRWMCHGLVCAYRDVLRWIDEEMGR